MEAIAYLHLQLRLEGKEVLNGRFLRQIEVVPDEEVPLILISQLATGEVLTYYDESLASDLQTELAVRYIDFPNIDPFIDILQGRTLLFEVGHYKTYIFPFIPTEDVDVICMSKHDSRVKAFGFDGPGEKVFTVEKNAALVSACVSTRENERCGEAWVYTAPEYRHQGFAQKVVNAWAANLMETGKVPFYSHKIENKASAKLAKKLGLQPVFEEIVIVHTCN